MEIFRDERYSKLSKNDKIGGWVQYIYHIDREQLYSEYFSFSKELYELMKQHDPNIDLILEEILKRTAAIVQHKYGEDDDAFIRDSLTLINHSSISLQHQTGPRFGVITPK